MSELLVPTRIVDKNGKVTTVHKRALAGKPGKGPTMINVVLTDPKTREAEALFNDINLRLMEMGLGEGERTITSAYPCASTMTSKQLLQSLRLFDSYLADHLLVDKIQMMFTRLSAGYFDKWLSTMDRVATKYTEMNDYGDIDNTGWYPLHVVSDVVCGVIRLQEDNEDVAAFTDEQVVDFIDWIIISRQVQGNGLREQYSDAEFGDITAHLSTNVLDFYLEHDRDEMDSAEMAIIMQTVTRFPELEVLFNKGVTPPLISGVL